MRILVVVFALLVSACTPADVQTWLGLHDRAAVTESTAVVIAGWLDRSPTIDGWVDLGHGIWGPPILRDIRRCESRDNYAAQNSRSSASGAYQFLRSSWVWYGFAGRYGAATAAQAKPWQQDEAAVLTWLRDGTRPWDASALCWY